MKVLEVGGSEIRVREKWLVFGRLKQGGNINNFKTKDRRIKKRVTKNALANNRITTEGKIKISTIKLRSRSRKSHSL